MIRVKMEEEEDQNGTPKKTRRKRKPKRDSSPGIPSAGSEEEQEQPKKKRGRKKKKVEPPPEEEELTDLQTVMRVVEQLMSSPGSDAFLHRPDDSVYGLSDYYEVITKPMWLKEVERKYKADKYDSPTEMAADVRLMLENCYHYWGPNDDLSKRALKLEQLFENKLNTLPQHLRDLCSLEATHADLIKEESDDSASKRTTRKGVYVSRLLNWVIDGKVRREESDKPVSSQDSVTKVRQAERGEAEKQLSLWETEHLLTTAIKEQIASMWEFPVIGQFLHMVYGVLNVDPIPHIELERMMLMPQSSKSLAILITSMLIPPLFRAKLEVGPAMPYCVWSQRLSNKVALWYKTYHSKGDSTVEVHKRQSKVFDSLGIEPHFWLVMGEDNPLADYAFHELSFLQRVWLLKGLCDFIMHNHKTIQDCINNLEMEDLREQNLGKDKDGYSYHYFPMFTEVRIYRMAKVPDAKWKSYEKGVEEAITMCAEEEDDEETPQEPTITGFSRRPLHKPPRSLRPSHSDCRLVCQSLQDVRELTDELCAADPQGKGPNAPLVARLQRIVSQLQSRESKMELAVFNVRSRMRDEWMEHKERRPDYVDPGIAYWERKAKEFKAVEEKESEHPMYGSSKDSIPDDEKRQRRAKRESSFRLLSKDDNGDMGSESGEESPMDFDDNSEDEWFASKKEKDNKKKRRCLPNKKARKQQMAERNQLASSKDKEIDSRSQSSRSSLATDSGVKIKEEPCDEEDAMVHTSQSNKTSTNKQLPFSQVNKHGNESATNKKHSDKSKNSEPVICKQEIVDEPPVAATTTTHNSVIQSLVRPVSNVKLEKASKPAPIVPDLSKVKRSNSPDSEVVYISDSDDPPDIKPNPALLAKRPSINAKSMETINYSMTVPQQQVSGYLVPNAVPNQAQFLPVNVAPGDQVFGAQQPVYNVAQQQPMAAYPIAPTQTIVQTPVIRPNPAVVRLQTSPRANLNPNQKFLVIQPNPNSVNQASPRAQVGSFPTTPTMQPVNWFGARGGAQSNYSPRQRGGGTQSPRGRGSPRSPMTPPRGGVQRFTGRTPNTPRTPNAMPRTPTQLGARGISPMRGRGVTPPVRPGPVRNLNFNRSPAKPVSKPVNDSSDGPDIEGTLVVSLTDSGGFGYVVMLPDGGKISLTNDQLAKIRSDNGGTLPKTCKVPLNMQTEGFRID